MKKLGIIVALLFMGWSNSFSQSEFTRVSSSGSTFGVGRYEKGQYGNSGVTLHVSDGNYNTAKRTLYANESWTNGNIITKSGKLINNLSFRYDVYNDKIEMRSYVNPEELKMVTVGKDFYLYVPFIKNNYEKNGYMLLVIDGYAKLLLRKEVKKMPGKGGAYGYNSTEVINSMYYIKVAENPAKYFNKGVDIFTIIPDRHEELKAYIKTNKLKLKKRTALIKLLTYYNSFYEK